MEIIHELESSPRGIYTGSIFQLYPDGNFDLNVCIRTIECRQNEILLGIGSGIVADSGSGPEWNECLLKSSFLNFSPPPNQVFTTLLWTKESNYENLELHLARLKESCNWLLRKFDAEKCKADLKKLEQILFDSASFAKIRINVDLNGKINLIHQVMDNPYWKNLRVSIYLDEKVVSKDPYIFTKQVIEKIYDRAFSYAQERNLDEVILLNENDEVCEGSISTLKIINKK